MDRRALVDALRAEWATAAPDLQVVLLDEPAVATAADVQVLVEEWARELSASAQVVAATQVMRTVDEAATMQVWFCDRKLGTIDAAPAEPSARRPRAIDEIIGWLGLRRR